MIEEDSRNFFSSLLHSQLGWLKEKIFLGPFWKESEVVLLQIFCIFVMSQFALKCFGRHKVAEKNSCQTNHLGKRRENSKCINMPFTCMLVLLPPLTPPHHPPPPPPPARFSSHTCFTLFVFHLVLPWWFMITLYMFFQDLSDNKCLTCKWCFRILPQKQSQTYELERSFFWTSCYVAVGAERVRGEFFQRINCAVIMELIKL